MTLTDLERQILELNEILISQKVLQIKMGIGILHQLYPPNQHLSVNEAGFLSEGEKWMLELRSVSKDGYMSMLSLWESKRPLEEWNELAERLRAKQDRIMEVIAKKVCEQPIALSEAVQVVQQWGVHYVDNPFQVIGVMADIKRVAPKTPHFVYSGPMGLVYYLVPRTGWKYERKEPYRWHYVPDEPIAPPTYKLDDDTDKRHKE